MFEVNSKDLANFFDNLLLYTNLKAVRLRHIFFSLSQEILYGYACDDYIALQDKIHLPDAEDKDFALSVENLSEARAMLTGKVAGKGTVVKLSFFNTYMKMKTDDGEVKKFEFFDPDMDSWNHVFGLLDEKNPTVSMDLYAVRPDRFVKLAQLKAEKEAPVIFRGVEYQGHFILQFRKGSSISGVYVPVREEYIQEEFLWKNN